ncbi:MAG: XdhC family protein [Deltaproteobacteria bacterium]|nr:XdhC family protein [Deltaproteobacteria bacterium]
MDLWERLAGLRAANERAVLVTVVATRGSTPRKPGAKMLFFPDGHIEGTVGGGKVEHVIRTAAARVLANEQAAVVTHNLTTELAMCCGGQMTFFLEPIMSQPVLIVFGCGHVGTALIEAALPLGFDIVAVDDLVENANPERLPQATRIINSYEPEDLRDLPTGDNVYTVILTREHAFDQRLLEHCITRPGRYLGVIGSERKAQMQRERLAAKGFDAALVDKVRCPIGLDIGAETPAEIAVSICAELTRSRRGARAPTPTA